MTSDKPKISTIATVIATAAALISCAAAPDYQQRVMEYQNRKNQQELEFILDMFTQDGSFSYSYESGKKVLGLLQLWRQSAERD